MCLSNKRLIAAAATLALLSLLPLSAIAAPTGPDVGISASDIHFSNDYPKTGDTVSINVTVHNVGETEATAITVRFFTDQELIPFAQKDISRIAPNATGNIEQDWLATIPKTYTIFVKINCTADLNLANNNAEKTLTVTAGGTVTVTSKVDPASCDPEQAYWVNGTVKIATQSQPGASVTVTVRDKAGSTIGTPASTTTNDLGVYAVNLTAPRLAGDYMVESSATSGTLKGNDTQTLHVVLPDITVLEITFSSQSPAEGDKVTITAHIKNIGTKTVDSVEVAFYQDQNRIGTNKEGPLAADNATTSTMSWTAVKGTHQMKVVIDPSSKVNEISEENNALTVPLTVKEKPGGGGGNTLMIVGVVVVIAVVAVAAVILIRRRRKAQ
jgi:subtilase family serine protease